MNIRRVSSERDLKKAFAIRLRVFVKEQGVPLEVELDRDDKTALHLLAEVAGKAAGTARIVLRRRSAKIGRMAVLKSYRNIGIGKALLKKAIEMAKLRGAQRIYLHAQLPVVGFYQAMGFRSVGPVFTEAAIRHRKMIFTSEVQRREPRV